MANPGSLAEDQPRFGAESAGAKLKKKAPSAAVIDSQSVKMASQRGFDAGKKIMGRKRHILVDTLGLLIGVVVYPANIQDRDGAKLLEPFLHASPGVEVVFADGGYAGALATWIKDLPRPTPLRLEIIKRSREATGFHLLPKRWVVERTFAWLANFRRFSKDYEVKTAHSEAMIYLANASLMARKLAKN